MKLARDGGVVLDRNFYSRASQELGQWGQDQEALAEVTKRLQVIEGVTRDNQESVPRTKSNTPSKRR